MNNTMSFQKYIHVYSQVRELQILKKRKTHYMKEQRALLTENRPK